MAEVITRFKLETTQYDSKLRNTAKSLSDITRMASLAGSEFGKFTQKNVEAARSFGNIATSATNGKDKVKELVSAFNDVAKSYNVLTKEQQQSDFGQALAQSMQTLKGRISEAKAEMNSTGGILGQLKDKFTINIDALKLFNIGLKAAKGALDVAKDAFFASESNVDDWGRTMRASKSLYEGFLTALNTGDISGYLSNIQTIVSAATDAYNAIDRLSTQKAIDNPRLKAQEVENERFRAMLRTGRYIAPNDGRKATMAEGTKLSKETLSVIARMLENGMKNNRYCARTEIDYTSEAIKALYKEQAARLNMSYKEFVRGTSSMGEFEKRLKGYQSYMDYERAHTYTPTAPYPGAAVRPVRDNTVNPFSQYRAWGVFKDDGSLYNEILGLINQRAGLQSQNYNSIAQMYRSINRVDNGAGPGTGAGGGTGMSSQEQTEMQANQTKINALTQEYVKLADDATQETQNRLAAIREEISLLETRNSKLKLYEEQAQGKYQGGTVQTTGLGDTTHLSGTDYMSVGSGLSNLPSQQQQPAMKTPKEMAKDLSQATQTLSSISSGINNIFSGIEQLGIELPQGLKDVLGGIQAVAGILTAISSLITIITAIQSAKAVPVIGTFLAGGGVIRAAGGTLVGNSYSGDNLRAIGADGQLYGLNAGEVVLNRAQTNAVASQLTDGGGGGTTKVVGVLKGEDIVLMADRYGRRRGLGELVFGKNL